MFLRTLLNKDLRNHEARILILPVFGLALAASLTAQPGATGVAVGSGTVTTAGPMVKNAMYIGANATLEGKVVTGAPYTATITTTLTQTLADGNHIVQKQESSVARDSAGRTRREESLNNIGPWSTPNTSPIVFINDPVAQVHYVLEPDGKTAMKMSLQGGPMAPPMSDQKTFFFIGQPGETLSQGALPAPPPDAQVHVMTRSVAGASVMPDAAPGPNVMRSVIVSDAENGADDKVQTLTDQTLEGVLAHGKQVTTTIPAGTIGNDQPIVITSETWYSPDLQTVVLSKRNDPRIGESVMAVTNIQRGEPSAALFQVPAGYTVKEGGPQLMKIQAEHAANPAQ
ncbi:MAG: hypothetical protein WBW33_11560 [Bryobacteraceae bacterium]